MTCGRYIPQAGGLPVLRDGRCGGAVGASGSSGQQDEDVVRRALELLRTAVVNPWLASGWSICPGRSPARMPR